MNDPNKRFDRLLERMAPPSERKKSDKYFTPEEVLQNLAGIGDPERQKRGKPV